MPERVEKTPFARMAPHLGMLTPAWSKRELLIWGFF
jgi:hypothetical protein